MPIPSSTYRVQLHAGFTLRQLEDILEYLHELGISAIYASPITQAVKGSQHGYDVSVPWSLNPEIGTEEDLERISTRLKEYGMLWVQDIVPNHMAFDHSNPWIYDVLERGNGSDYYYFFDIEPSLSREAEETQLLVPFLANELADSVRKNEIKLVFSGKGFEFHYFDQKYPLAPSSYRRICTVRPGCPFELFNSLKKLEATSRSSAVEWKGAKQNWVKEMSGHPDWHSYIHEQLNFINRSPDILERLISEQHYILSPSQSTTARINYRRFFAINSLICLRMEEEAVFSAYHQKLFDWHRRGWIQGFRIDHIDGLARPGRYIRQLREVVGDDGYLVAEKILAVDEPLPEDWEIQGTTGYEFLAQAAQLFTDRDGLLLLKEFYLREIAPDTSPYDDLVFEKKLHFLKTQMNGELNNAVDFLFRPGSPAMVSLDKEAVESVDKGKIREALAILMASFPVYRLYPEISPLPEAAARMKDEAFTKAKQRGTDFVREFDFLSLCLGDPRCLTRIMQFTGPLAAKGIEDTTFYIYNPLISRNEVGDTPGKDGLAVEEFHLKMRERQRKTPDSLNAGTTHDTKRGEDSRIRLNYLTSVPDLWINAVNTWRTINAGLVKRGNGISIPSVNEEYFIYQSLLGAIPADLVITGSFLKRFSEFLIKALREAGVNTKHTNPDADYEKACLGFLDAILDPGSEFLQHFLPIADEVVKQGMCYSLAQLLLRLTAPGIPDVYQGAELWELSLVDPDNRRPVDFVVRKELLKTIREGDEKGWPVMSEMIHSDKGKEVGKMFLIYKVLGYRTQFPDLFSKGDYIPVDAPDKLFCFLRRDKTDWMLVCLPLIRKEAGVSTTRKDSGQPAKVYCRLPEGAPENWMNLFTGDMLRICGGDPEIGVPFAPFPVIVLTAKG